MLRLSQGTTALYTMAAIVGVLLGAALHVISSPEPQVTPIFESTNQEPADPILSAETEILDERTYRSKEFSIPAGTTIQKMNYNTGEYEDYVTQYDGEYKTMRSYGQDIHYKENGEFVESDLSFADNGTEWSLTKHNYHLRVAKSFSNTPLIHYENKYEGANHSIEYTPTLLVWVANDDINNFQVWRTRQNVTGTLNGDVIRYTDAFGPGVHFEITRLRSGFTKEIVIDDLSDVGTPPSPNHKLVALFEFDSTGVEIVDQDQNTWNKRTYFKSQRGFEFAEGDAVRSSFLQPAYMKASPEVEFAVPQSTPIEVFWAKRGNSLYQGKIFDMAFLNKATFPVRIDTTTSYNTGAGDGYVGYVGNPWSTARTAVTGTAAGPTDVETYVHADFYSSTHHIYRSWFPADTSGLGAGASISSATFNFHIDALLDLSSDYVGIVPTSAADTSTLTTADYDAIGSTDYGTKSFSNLSVNSSGQTNSITLNATGLAAISKTGTTEMGLRLGADIDDVEPASRHYINTRTSEQTNSGEDPFYEITYTAGAAPVAPSPARHYWW